MINTLLIQLLADIINRVLSRLDENTVRVAIDGILDKLETAVVRSSTKLDDLAILPLLRKLRDILGVPDDDQNEP